MGYSNAYEILQWADHIAIVQEIFTLCLSAQRPHDLKVIEELRTIQLRIWTKSN